MMIINRPDTTEQQRAARTRHFSFPHEVVDDPSLSTSQKRALLCEWASDAHAVEGFPTLRLLPGTTFPVTFSAVMDALGHLDRACARTEEQQLAKRGVIVEFSRRKDGQHRER